MVCFSDNNIYIIGIIFFKMKLNIGTGNKKIEGSKSMDIRSETKPDYLVDLEKENSLHKIPENFVDEIFMGHTFEHIKNITNLMKEIYRVCKNNAKVVITSPYWSHRTAVEDPTHVRFMTENSMMYFNKETTGSDGSNFVKGYNFKIVGIGLNLDKRCNGMDIKQLRELMVKEINVIQEIIYELKVIKI